MSGLMPTYKFIPNLKSAEPKLRTCSSRRARLTKGGTYFRSKDLGLNTNNLSIEVIELKPPTDDNPEAYCVITNHDTLSTENISGNLSAPILSLKGTYADLWKFTSLNGTPHAHYYSISLRIAFRIQEGEAYDLDADPEDQVAYTDLGNAPYDALFTADKIAIKPAPGAAPASASDVAFVRSRRRIYKLSTIANTPGAPPEGGVATPPTQVWDIVNLRTQVASNPWVEMLERSGPTAGATPTDPPVENPNPADVQDTGTDDLVTGLVPFALTNLSGGDGLPSNPNQESTGPTRSIVHVNYGEATNGKLIEVNTVYEWAGESSSAGTWKSY